jgi:hypothetical protein
MNDSLEPKTLAALFSLLGGPTKAGRICGYTGEHVQQRGSDMKRRGIPRSRWDSVVAWARRRGLPITLETLHRLHPRKRRNDPPEGHRPKAPAPTRAPDLFDVAERPRRRRRP